MHYQTEVDGVPTLVAHTAGPMIAGLTFRVGVADETLSTAGITHLVEHLALHRHGLTDYHFNGATAAAFTTFHMQGTEGDVTAYLNGVCESLIDLPMDRLETEKAILRTEAASRSVGANDQLPLWRYGARGYGLVSYNEFGLAGLHPDDLRQWVNTYFTRDNAVLWIAGSRVPTDLRLRLPAGRRQPAPIATSALPQQPAYFADGQGKVLMDAVVRRRVAASVYSGVLERELYRTLRQEGGYSYVATTAYHPRGDGFATVTALADALPDKQPAVVGGFIDALARLRVGRIDPSDVDAVRTKAASSFDHPEIDAGRLPGMAMNLLTGQPDQTVEALRAELAAVTVAEVQQVALEAAGTALLQVPEDHSADWAGFAAAPTHSTSLVEGVRFQHLGHGCENVSLIVGHDGASLDTPGGPVTVRFAECAAKLSWPDGARRLIGYDGIVLHIEPTLYQIDPNALAAIDARVRPQSSVWMPAREPGTIPKPRPKPADAPTPGVPAPPQVKRKRSVVAVVGIVLLSIVVAFCGLTTLLVSVGEAADTKEPFDWTTVIILWVGTALFVTPLVLLVRKSGRPK